MADPSRLTRCLDHRYVIDKIGFMLSVLCNRTDITAGASAAVFGILGGLVAYLIINWTAL
jgi:hypothetical protein